MYYWVYTISVIFRQFFMANPFENVAIEVPLGTNFLQYDNRGNACANYIYGCRDFYKRRSSPAVGSMLFLMFYLVHNGLLLLMSKAEFNKIIIGIILVAYIAFLTISKKIVMRMTCSV